MGGKSGQTIGFHYMMDLLFGIGRGPMNSLRAIKVGDKLVWDALVCDGDVYAIDKPDIFGGEKKEGGIQGPFRIFWGDQDQILPGAGSADCGTDGPLPGVQPLPDVKAAIVQQRPSAAGKISEMRGTTRLWFSGLVSSMNPYLKNWEFRWQRYSAGWYNNVCWYPEKSVIFMANGYVRAMNPAHILFECFTNPEWGRGYAWSDLDENSFVYAANTLCSENFGLCFVWQRDEQNVDDFIEMVCQYIDAEWYTDPGSGKVVLQMHRADYVAAALPLFTPQTGLIDILEDDSASGDEVFTQIVGTGRDPITNEDFSVRVYNLAASVAQGAPNTAKKDYKGIPTKDLMARVLARDLRVPALGLKRYKVVLDRRGFALRPGMPFRIQDDRRGIGNVIVRAGQIDDKSFKDGRLTMTVVQDVFGLPSTSFVTAVDSDWTPPPTEAVPAVAEQLVEANYRDCLLREDVSVVNALTDTDSLIGVVALAPNAAMYQFDLASKADGEADYKTTSGAFTGAATLTANIGPLDTSFVVGSESSFDSSNVGQALLCDAEQMSFESYNAATHTVTVKRGCADTVPASHAAGARLWTIDDDLVSDERKYVSGETVDAAVLTRTSSDVLTIAEATVMTLAVNGRQARPYPPAKVTVDGAEALTITGTHGAPVLNWVHRDRVLQQDQLVGYSEASVGPEPGTTYTIRIYDVDGMVGDPPLRTVTGLAAGPWTYDATMQAADGDPVAVFIELESERDGLASYQHHRFRVQLKGGWGNAWGFDWGGI
jgi:hypothetical protein